MESNRVSNKGSITSLMQDPRQTLEHMFSDQECLVSKIHSNLCHNFKRKCQHVAKE